MTISTSYGYGGWMQVARDSWPHHVVFVRMQRQDGDGPYRAREVYVVPRDNTPVDASLLRDIPMVQLESFAAVDEHELDTSIKLPGPDLETAARFYGTHFGSAAPQSWVRDMMWSQYDDSEFAPLDPPPPPLPPPPEPMEEILGRAVVLDVPSGGGDKGDDFYRSVADAYRYLAPRTRAVAKTIAEANGVRSGTVHRWVREARQRGFLGPASHGRISP